MHGKDGVSKRKTERRTEVKWDLRKRQGAGGGVRCRYTAGGRWMRSHGKRQNKERGRGVEVEMAEQERRMDGRVGRDASP